MTGMYREFDSFVCQSRRQSSFRDIAREFSYMHSFGTFVKDTLSIIKSLKRETLDKFVESLSNYHVERASALCIAEVIINVMDGGF